MLSKSVPVGLALRGLDRFRLLLLEQLLRFCPYSSLLAVRELQ